MKKQVFRILEHTTFETVRIVNNLELVEIRLEAPISRQHLSETEVQLFMLSAVTSMNIGGGFSILSCFFSPIFVVTLSGSWLLRNFVVPYPLDIRITFAAR